MPSSDHPSGADPSADAVGQEQAAIEAVERLRPFYQALPRHELLRINIDIPSAIVTVLGALPQIRKLRPSVCQQTPEHDMRLFDSIEDAALALNELHAQYLLATRPPDGLQQLITEATELRDRLLADVSALTTRGFIDRNDLVELKRTSGHRNLAFDLNLLQLLLRRSWAQIQGKSAVTVSELDRASKLQQRILRVIGERALTTSTITSARDLRQRAFTYFVHAYDQTRRAITYLLWDSPNPSAIPPSLYSGRGNRKRKTPTLTVAPHDSSPSHTIAPGSRPPEVETRTEGAVQATGTASASMRERSGNSGGGLGGAGEDPFLN
ncbi:MAG TPA: hypothetical protein VFQ61_01450 [Polyangiaceae bacterium]|nr:hypothetical protein [Polyangiaceae bacterium]